MEGARIITLVEPVQSGGEVTFEEAFGEHSEARGSGRARRQARRMARINKRRERKSAKQEARQERKNRRVEGRNERKASKGRAQREETMADAENEKAVEDLNPQEDESTGYEQSSEDSGEEQAPEELDQNSDAEDSESEFEAGSTDEYASSFDAESSDASGPKPKKPQSPKQLLNWHNRSIKFHQDKIAALKAALSSGKLPSNLVAQKAKDIRKLEGRIQQSMARIEMLKKRMEAGAQASPRPRHKAMPGMLTPVGRNLHAKIEQNRIEVPANSSAEGDIFNCADGDDFASFDAKEVVKKNKNILIGVGVAAAVIVGLHFAGVFKK